MQVNEDILNHPLAVVTTWGITDNKSNNGRLQVVPYSFIINKDNCRGLYDTGFEETSLTVGNVCATYPHGENTCDDDSAAAMVLFGRLAGIVSWGGLRCNRPYSAWPSVYTEIAYFREWIDRNARE